VLQEQVLERLILSEIQLQRAARIGLQVSDEMLNQSIAGIAQQNGGWNGLRRFSPFAA
jgi:peptidyl-prolyl cis-trans isomerase SurA